MLTAIPVRSARRPDPETDYTWPRPRTAVALPVIMAGTGISLDTSIKMSGKANSIRVRSTAVGTVTSTSAATGSGYLTTPRNFTGKNLVLWWRLVDSSAASIRAKTVAVQFSSDNFSTTGAQAIIESAVGSGDQLYSDFDRWIPVEIAPHFESAYIGGGGFSGKPMFFALSGKVEPDWTAITHMKVSVVTEANAGATAQVDAHLGGIDLIDRPSEPVISFVFDRYNDEMYNVAFPKLTAMGWKGTLRGDVYDLIVGSGTTLSLAQAQAIYAAGWDVGVYDYAPAGFIAGEWNWGNDSTTPYVNRAKATVLSNLRYAQQFLIENGMPGNVDLLAGQARKAYQDAQTDLVLPHFNYANVPQGAEYPCYWPPIDPMNVPNKMYVKVTDDNDGNHSRLKQTIDRAIANKEWLSLLFHTIDEATSPPPDGFALTSAKFQSILDYVQASGAKVRTVSQVLHGQV